MNLFLISNRSIFLRHWAIEVVFGFYLMDLELKPSIEAISIDGLS